MQYRKFRLSAYFTLMLLGFAPLVYWGSSSRYQQQIEEATHERIIQAAREQTVALRPKATASEEDQFPVAGKSLQDVISYFGDPRGQRSHAGIDIKADKGTAVLAIADGVVERVSNGGKGGQQVWLQLEDGRTVFYAHLHEQWVEEGEAVSAGQAVGSVGNTGNARGSSPHLHFEIRLPKKGAVDPTPFLKKP